MINRLPDDTPIVVQQENPKRGQSRTRYEQYKAATSVAEFLKLGGRRADLVHDMERGFIVLPHEPLLACMPRLTQTLAQSPATLEFDTHVDPPLDSIVPQHVPMAYYHLDGIFRESGSAGYTAMCGELHRLGVLVPQASPSRPPRGVHFGTISNVTYAEATKQRPYVPCLPDGMTQNRSTPSIETRWGCHMGLIEDTADLVAGNILQIMDSSRGEDPLDKMIDRLKARARGEATPEALLEALQPAPDATQAERRVETLGHQEEPGDDPIDVLIWDEWTQLPCAMIAKAEGEYGKSPPNQPPPGRTPPTEDKTGDPASVGEMLRDSRWAIEGGWRDKYLDEMLQLFDEYKAVEHATLEDYFRVKRELAKEGKGRKAFIIPTTVVPTVKRHADGSFHRLKIRICAAQTRKRFDMGDAWSPTVGMDTVRFLLTIAAMFRCWVSTVDVSGAYLNGRRTDDDDVIFLRTPPGLDKIGPSLEARGLGNDPRFGIRTPNGDMSLWYCPGNLYGLQQSGKVWYLFAREWLISDMGMTQSCVDPCLFFRYFEEGEFILLALYVDDSLQVMSSLKVRDWYLKEFEKKFKQSPGSGGNTHDFLGMTLVQSDDRRIIRLNTPKLWIKLRARTEGMKLPTHTTAPLGANALQDIYCEPDLISNRVLSEEEFPSRGILGMLAWAVLAVRPGEQFTCSLLSRKIHNFTEKMVPHLLHAVAYCLQREKDEVIIGAGDRNLDPFGVVDSSWGNDPSTNRSWFGYSLKWGGAAFCTRAKLQNIVALSSRDAEAIAMVYAVKAILGFIIMMKELKLLPGNPLRIWVDNKATVDGAHSDKVAKDSRHQAMRLAWLRDVVRSALISAGHIDGNGNSADIHTKILPGPLHAKHRASLMGHTGLTSLGASASSNVD